ncbi:uncharacterized protein LY79DRAFT_540500 [Colletotrichum navitas]|uniref:Uncharacterized protein n=1 Tax=Colletotrichum navitas TaxID=681940 RepID=A0AAD8V7Y0_9PEZI|nr:uncharacterized protein LY79DRAFT_540500 [Colletotrichum navitas]KAK1597617.1 hypothetical protein LY79DRAFT_540500 [Colletotrichum navitas]
MRLLSQAHLITWILVETLARVHDLIYFAGGDAAIEHDQGWNIAILQPGQTTSSVNSAKVLGQYTHAGTWLL